MRSRYQPIEELAFACRVGFLTRNIWREFFAKGCQRWQNKLWARLRTDGFFRPHPAMPELYLPNPKNRTIDPGVPFVAGPPSLNQIRHDELVARTCLLIERQVPHLQVKTEAYLKKEVPLRNKGLRTVDSEKHPDLVIRNSGEETAIEIELTQKSRAKYRTILRSYRRTGFKKVIYIIRSASTMHAIDAAASEISFPRDQIQLGFGSMGDWRINPLVTKINFDHSVDPLWKALGLESDPNRTLAE